MPVKDYAYMVRVLRSIVQTEVEMARGSLHQNSFVNEYLGGLLTRLDKDIAADLDSRWLWEWRTSVMMLEATASMADATSALSLHHIDTANARKEVADKIYSLLRMMVSVEHNATTTLPLEQHAADGPTPTDSPGPDGAGIDAGAQPAVS